MNKNGPSQFVKVVDNLTVEQLIEYDDNDVHTVLVRNKVSDEVREVARWTFVFVYDGLDEETIQRVLTSLDEFERRDKNES